MNGVEKPVMLNAVKSFMENWQVNMFVIYQMPFIRLEVLKYLA